MILTHHSQESDGLKVHVVIKLSTELVYNGKESQIQLLALLFLQLIKVKGLIRFHHFRDALDLLLWISRVELQDDLLPKRFLQGRYHKQIMRVHVFHIFVILRWMLLIQVQPAMALDILLWILMVIIVDELIPE